jgi:hypothetical protein
MAFFSPLFGKKKEKLWKMLGVVGIVIITRIFKKIKYSQNPDNPLHPGPERHIKLSFD